MTRLRDPQNGDVVELTGSVLDGKRRAILLKAGFEELPAAPGVAQRSHEMAAIISSPDAETPVSADAGVPRDKPKKVVKK